MSEIKKIDFKTRQENAKQNCYDNTSDKLDKVMNSIETLNDNIAIKVKIDGYKENIILDLCRELENLKKGFYKQTIGIVINDIDIVINDLEKSILFHQDSKTENIKKTYLISLLESYMSDLNSITERYKALNSNE